MTRCASCAAAALFAAAGRPCPPTACMKLHAKATQLQLQLQLPLLLLLLLLLPLLPLLTSRAWGSCWRGPPPLRAAWRCPACCPSGSPGAP
jgi:hypothetical protein